MVLVLRELLCLSGSSHKIIKQKNSELAQTPHVPPTSTPPPQDKNYQARLANLEKGREKLRLQREEKRIQAQLQRYEPPKKVVNPPPSSPQQPQIHTTTVAMGESRTDQSSHTHHRGFEVRNVDLHNDPEFKTGSGGRREEAKELSQPTLASRGLDTVKEASARFIASLGIAFVLALISNGVRYYYQNDDAGTPASDDERKDDTAGRFNGISIFK